MSAWQVGDEPVPGFRLESFLGEGSNATVWRASAPGRTAAALKFINLDGNLGLKEFRGIERVKEIRHAHLLPITAFWLLDDQGYVLDDRALESLHDRAHGREAEPRGTLQPQLRWPKTLVVAMLLGEKNLLERLEECQMAGSEGIPVGELLDYMEDAAKGIDFLNSPRHDLGNGPAAIQHCDIKPQNILLVGDSAMVCDFGLARVLGSADTYRTITGPAGTPAYVAPECIQGAIPSHATDQYSLAITYFELQTGKLPFASEALLDIYEAHQTGNLELDALPEAERLVIRRATSPKPEDRYPGTLEMVRALRLAAQQRPATEFEVQAPAPVEAPSPTPTPSCPEYEVDVPAADSEPGQHPTYVIQFVPNNVEVTINHTRRKVDPEGKVAIECPPDASLEICATAEGYEEFRAPLRLGQLESWGFTITLQRDAQFLVKRGTTFLESGDVAAAIADFDEAIDLAPDMAEAYYGRAMAHGATEEHRRDCALAYDEQAHAHFATGHYEMAIADFTEAMRLDPELVKAHQGRILRNRAVAYRNQGQYDKAIADYDEVIRLHPNLAKAYHGRATVYAAMRNYDQAIDDYAQAIRLMPGQPEAVYHRDYASAYRQRGDAYYENGEFDRAIADYDEAIRLRPNWGIVYNQRGRAHGAKGDWERAIADYTQAIEFDAEFAYLYFYNRGSVHFKNGDFNRAIDDLTAAIEQKPDYAKAYRYRSRAYAEIGMGDRAEADLASVKTLQG